MFIRLTRNLKRASHSTFIFTGLFLVGLATNSSIVWSNHDPIVGIDKVCYAGLLPKLIKNPRDNTIYFISYSLLKGKLYKSGRCDPQEVAIFLNELPSSDVESRKPCNFREPDCPVGNVFAEPIALGDTEDSPPKRLTDWGLFKTIAYPELDFKWWLNTIHGLENLLLESIVSFRLRIDENEFGIGLLKEEIDSRVIWNHGIIDQIDKNYDKKPGRVQSTKSHYGAIPFLSSNGCWLVVPRMEKYNSLQKVVKNKKGFPEKIQDSRVNTYIQKTRQNLSIYSLDENRNGKICKFPAYRVAGTKAELPKQTIKHLFHTKVFPAVENPTEIGVDYSAFSPLESPEQLHVVYQQGFPSDSCYSPDTCVTGMPNEKGLSGDLIYRIFRRDNATDPTVKMKDADAINLTKKCSFGWELNPKFSRDKKRLFFLAMEVPGDTKSKNNLYVIDVSKIRNAISDQPKTALIEKQYKHFDCGAESVIKVTKDELNFDRPILDYSLSADSKKLQITFEERGESVVRFFKFNKKTNEIVYQYPESISGIGKIYDVTRAGFLDSSNDNPVYYVVHSHLNFPVSISRCFLSDIQFVCGSRFSPIYTTKIGKELSGSSENSKKSNISDKVSIGRTTAEGKYDDKTYPIDVFILHPENKNENKKAIVSVHGGPYEAWDGRFSPREHRLAQLGYTIYLPNPSGSTGYGQWYTDNADESWGNIIYEDIGAVVQHVKDLKLHEEVYLMGFSFGGYMVNRIQTHEDSSVRDKLKAMIAINPLFDLKEFAASTDQLWFPEFYLKCSYPESKRIPFCERNPSDQTCAGYKPVHSDHICKSENSPMIADQNPADFISNLSNKSPPTLFIVGDADQRIPFFYNVPPMLNAYRRQCAPHTLQVEKFLSHGFPNFRAREQGDLINSWLKDLDDDCPVNKSGTDKLFCKTKRVPDNCEEESKVNGQCPPVISHNPLLHRRESNFLFDNVIGYLPGTMLDDVQFDQCFEIEKRLAQ